MDKPRDHRHIVSAALDSADAFKLRRLAEQSDRTVSAELRRLVRQRLAAADEADRLRPLAEDDR